MIRETGDEMPKARVENRKRYEKDMSERAELLIAKRFHAPRRAGSTKGVPAQVRELHEWRRRGYAVYQGSATSKWVHIAGRKYYRQHFLMCLQIEKLAQKIKPKT